MGNHIQLLPPNIANQIAAGEVVQRPASAVKELLENSIDSGADQITLSVKNGGKTLIQVSDNGSGMSVPDCKLCIQRHATSKIRKVDDLFAIKTMGFRGEAIASIAAIAHLEIKTKTSDTEEGYRIKVVGGDIEESESCAMTDGTVVSVKNLFFNVPARRNFLKSEQVEIRHIIEEFQRVAMVNPNVGFKMYHNDHETFNLIPGNFKKRILGILGAKYNNRLVPVEESTAVVSLSGYIVKPEFTKKTRGEQYFFVNNRFIKSPYLHHAVKNAYEGLIQESHYPSYFIKMDIDPKKIDVNIHPTKTEVKFEEEKNIYAIIRTSVKQALGKYNITPTLDFEQETSFNLPLRHKNMDVQPPQIKVDPSYNPFDNRNRQTFSQQDSAIHNQDWQKLYESQEVSQEVISTSWDEASENEEKYPLQFGGKYILSIIKSGLVIIDQHRAHLNVLLHTYGPDQAISAQSLLFPEELKLSHEDFHILQELKTDMKKLGFIYESNGENLITISALPSGVNQNLTPSEILEELIEEYKKHSGNVDGNVREQLLIRICKKIAIPNGKILQRQEMSALIDQLFACDSPNFLPSGEKVIETISTQEIDKKF